MPVAIGTGCDDTVVLNQYLMRLRTTGDDGSFVVLAHMKVHAFCVVALEIVTVDAVCLALLDVARILVDGCDVEVGEVTLVNAKLLVQLIAWLDETIDEVGVYVLFGHMEGIGRVVHPARWPMGVERYGDVLTFRVGQKPAPCYAVDVKLAVSSRATYEIANLGHILRCLLVCHHEVQRSDVRRHRHVAIVRIDLQTIRHFGEGCGNGGRPGGASNK